MSLSDWQTIRDGDPDRAVIGIDFAAGRAEAGFAELFADLDTTGLVIGPNFGPPAPDSGRATDPVAVLHGWRDDIGERPLRVEVVLGYCAGAGLAYGIADAIVRGGSAQPRVVLFDPVVPGPELLYSYYFSAIGSYGHAFTDAERREHRTAADASWPAARALAGVDLTGVMTDLSAAYTTITAQAVDRLGLDPAVGRFMTDRFAALLAYLVTNARAGLEPRPGRRPPTVILSAEHEPPPSMAAQVHRFDVDRVSLLADPRVAATVAACLARAVAAPPS
jgi:hypothetical protein